MVARGAIAERTRDTDKRSMDGQKRLCMDERSIIFGRAVFGPKGSLILKPFSA